MSSHIDPHALTAIVSLQRVGKPDLLARVVELFKSESPKLLASMQEAIAEGDMQTVRNASHSLKSSSIYVGARLLSERCREIEAAARDDNFPACIALGDGVNELFEASVIELDQYMSKVA